MESRSVNAKLSELTDSLKRLTKIFDEYKTANDQNISETNTWLDKARSQNYIYILNQMRTITDELKLIKDEISKSDEFETTVVYLNTKQTNLTEESLLRKFQKISVEKNSLAKKFDAEINQRIFFERSESIENDLKRWQTIHNDHNLILNNLLKE